MNRITLLFFLCVTFANAQSSWKKIDSENYKAKTELEFRKTSPKEFDLYSLDTQSLKNELAVKTIISMPVNDGFSDFIVKEVSSFTNPLASKYGYIKSFSLKGIDDKTATGKISIGIDGVHGIIFSGKNATTYIDPYTRDKSIYITYNNDQIEGKNDDFKCLLEESKITSKKNNSLTLSKNADDGTLRTYRLALACTGEYAQFHINNQGVGTGSDNDKRAAILSAMNTTMTRVNGIFEKDLATTMTIVVNSSGENELIFLDAETDNLTNDDAEDLIEESQSICDDVVGTSNYDIGHTFSTGAGGLAGLGVVCLNGQKARGVTGSGSPIGDTFDIDYVAHEIGHQFGANHTFNNSCGGNRSSSTSVEPGSGSTIMAYAGICGPDVVDFSDDYFHAVSIDQMWTVIQNTSCASETSTNNTAPIVNAGADVSVPKSTPLILIGEATDTDSNGLTYAWEQTDTEIATMPPFSGSEAGPAFRSLPPTNVSYRYLPTLETIVGGSIATEWEVLPSVARTLNFSLLVRDNNANGGASGRDDITITVVDTDPFVVTSQNTAVTWDVGATETITWDKSTTDQAPINCENVKILLSTDAGATFPITLIESTPNDGSYDVVVPNQITSTARIMVLGVDTIFYNVNTTNFSIASSGPTFVLSNTSEAQETCNDATSSITFDLDIDFLNGFSETVTLTAEDLPAGTDAVFSNNSANSTTGISLTINNFQNATAGNYTIKVNGNSTSLSSILELPTLTVNANVFTAVSLSSPQNNAVDVGVQELDLTWNITDTNTSSFDIEVATDANFNTIIISQENSTTNSFTLTEILDWDTTFYWRVKPKNSCGEGDFSSVFSFTTAEQAYCVSNFNQVDEYITNVTFGSINNDSGDANEDEENGAAGYQDFTEISTTLLTGTTYSLSVSFNPAGYQDHCYVFIDWNNDSIFSIATERYDLGTHEGDSAIATYDILVPEDATLGTTRMRVIIEYFDSNQTYGSGACDTDHNSEYGETEDYSLSIIDSELTASNSVFENFSLFPNPVEDNLSLLFDVAYVDKNVTLHFFDFTGKLVKTLDYQNGGNLFNESINLDNLRSGIYLLKITNGIIHTTKKIVVE